MARTNWYKKFQDMDSIYDESGNIKDATQLGFKDQEELDNAINYARSKGWGSINKGNNNYTIYAKNKDANNKLIMSEEDIPENMRGLYNPEGYAVLGAIDTYNKQKDVRGWDTNNRSIYSKSLESTPAENSKPEVGESPKVDNRTDYEKFYTERQRANLDFQKDLSSGRNRNFYNYYPNLYKDDFFQKNPEVRSSISKQYGLGNNFSVFDKDNDYWNAVNNVRGTSQFVTNNANLLKDRRAKSFDYLAKESKRLDRTVGNYGNLTYRDMLNYFNDENNKQWQSGKYMNDRDKFLQELYELGASRNGMQWHELQRLFGKDYDTIMQNIINNKNGQSSSLKNGGILKMLFI